MKLFSRNVAGFAADMNCHRNCSSISKQGNAPRGTDIARGAMFQVYLHVPGIPGAVPIENKIAGTSWADAFAGPCLARKSSGLAYFGGARSFTLFRAAGNFVQ